MASKKSTRKSTKSKAKHYPVVRASQLDSTTENAVLRILDVSKELSKLNRRLYRSGRYYQVKIDMNVANVGTYEVYALRDDWAVQKGFQMAYKMYSENTAAERVRLGTSNVARWEDFRVAPGVTGNNMLARLHQIDSTGVVLSAGEFATSNVVDSSNTQRTFTWGTPSATQYGVLQEYDKSGNAQGSPSSFTADGPYEEINTEVNATTMDDLQTDGNLPPYDQGGVNANIPFVKIANLGVGGPGDQRLSTGYFTAPCGIVVIVGPAADWNSSLMNMEVKAGDYKGVHAPSMLE